MWVGGCRRAVEKMRIGRDDVLCLAEIWFKGEWELFGLRRKNAVGYETT